VPVGDIVEWRARSFDDLQQTRVFAMNKLGAKLYGSGMRIVVGMDSAAHAIASFQQYNFYPGH
jgi:hypothetical protein